MYKIAKDPYPNMIMFRIREGRYNGMWFVVIGKSDCAVWDFCNGFSINIIRVL